MSDFQVGKLTAFSFSKSATGQVLELDLGNIRVLENPRNVRSFLDEQDSLVWVAGGGAYLIDSRYVVLVRRSADAPSNPGKITVLTGFSDSRDEWLNPSLLIREIFEEVLIFNKNKKELYAPNSWPQAEEIIGALKAYRGLSEYALVKVPCEVCKSLLVDEVRVMDRGEESVCRGLLHRNEERLNLMFLLRMELPCPISELGFRDGEMLGNEGPFQFLDREIYLFDLESGSFLDSNMQLTGGHELTPHAEYFLCAIKTLGV